MQFGEINSFIYFGCCCCCCWNVKHTHIFVKRFKDQRFIDRKNGFCDHWKSRLAHTNWTLERKIVDFFENELIAEIESEIDLTHIDDFLINNYYASMNTNKSRSLIACYKCIRLQCIKLAFVNCLINWPSKWCYIRTIKS